MLSKSLIQFSVDGWGCVPSLLFTWGQTLVEVMKINGDLPQKISGMYFYSPYSQPCSRPLLTNAFTRDSQTPTGKSPVGSLFLSPGSSIVGLMVTFSKRTYAIPTPRAPVPAAEHAKPYLHRRCSNTGVFPSLWGPWVLVCTRFV